MKTLRDSSRLNTGHIALAKSVALLMMATWILSLTSCVTLRKDAEVVVTLPKIIVEGDVTYWCLEKTDLTAIIQEADRCR